MDALDLVHSRQISIGVCEAYRAAYTEFGWDRLFGQRFPRANRIVQELTLARNGRPLSRRATDREWRKREDTLLPTLKMIYKGLMEWLLSSRDDPESRGSFREGHDKEGLDCQCGRWREHAASLLDAREGYPGKPGRVERAYMCAYLPGTATSGAADADVANERRRNRYGTQIPQ